MHPGGMHDAVAEGAALAALVQLARLGDRCSLHAESVAAGNAAKGYAASTDAPGSADSSARQAVSADTR